MHLRERYSSTAPALILTTENGRLTLGGALGTIDLLVSADASASVAAKTYVYDLKLVSGGGVVNHLIYGPCDVANEATK
jgi:hypothetical protein